MNRRLVLDTNIVSAVLRRHRAAHGRFREETRAGSLLYLCPVVYFEVLRGLRHRDAHGQERRLEAIAAGMDWEELWADDWTRAAQLWSDTASRGRRCDDDADVLIAAYALNRDAVVITDNTRDFEAFGVPLENWREE